MSVGQVSNDNIFVSNAPAPAELPSAGIENGFASVMQNTLTSGSVDLDAIFEEAAVRYNISSDLLRAVARAESSFRPNLTSASGAMGIMQLMPGTARYLGVTDPFNPEQNIMGGARYLREKLDQFDGDIQLALAAYNAGSAAVTRFGGIPPYTETQNYVRNVLAYLSGGPITAGTVTYGGSGIPGLRRAAGNGASGEGSFNLAQAITQMLFMKMIEMQMNSSRSDEKKFF